MKRHFKSLLRVSLFCLGIAGAGKAALAQSARHVATQLPDSLRNLFSYDPSVSPMTDVDSAYSEGGVRIEKISFNNNDSGKVSALLVLPLKPNHLAILYQHRAGDGYNKSEFLEESVSMALQGFTCLSIDAPWNCPNPKYAAFDQSPYQNDRIGCSNIRKALDLLTSLERPTIKGIFYVGHSFGADMASRVAALDNRIRAI